MNFVHIISSSAIFISTMLLPHTNSWNDIQDVGSPEGTWRGQSTCVGNHPSCHDEEVVYRITRTDGSDNYTINADRVVNGQAVNMGPLVFSYDKAKGILSSKNGKNHWQITLKGNQLEGVLLSDGEVFRRVKLTKG